MVSGKGFESAEASGMSRVGDDLRVARERLGYGLTDYAEGLRIRREYLAALEGGQFDALPAPAYAAGFLRAYGKALGLDADELVRRFKIEVAGGTSQTRLAFPVPAICWCLTMASTCSSTPPRRRSSKSIRSSTPRASIRPTM